MATEAAPLTGASPSLGDTGSAAATSATATEELVGTPSTETAEPGAGTTSEQADGGSAQEQQDGRVVPQKYRELFKSDPQLKSLFYSERAYRQSFATPAEATAARDLIERIGGEDGIADIEAQETERQRLNQQYTSPSPEHKREFVRGLLNDDPGAFKSIVPIAMDEYAKVDPQGYSRTMARVMVNTLNGAFNGFGMNRALQSVLANITAKPEQAVADIKAVINEFARFDELANARGMDAEREQFENEKRDWQRNRDRGDAEREFNDYASTTSKQGRGDVRRHIVQLTQGNPMKPEDLNATVDIVDRMVAEMALKDRDFVAKRDAMIARRDFARAERFVLAKYRQLLPEAAKREMSRLNRGNRVTPQPQQRATPAATASPSNGVVRLAKQPSASEIDWRRSNTSDVMKGKAVLKDGRRVAWD